MIHTNMKTEQHFVLWCRVSGYYCYHLIGLEGITHHTNKKKIEIENTQQETRKRNAAMKIQIKRL